MTTTPALELADRIRRELLPALNDGVYQFLEDGGGYIDVFAINVDDRTGYDAIVDISHEAVFAALDKAGISDAYVMDPGPGTVHVPTPKGSAFISDPDGGIPGTGPSGWSVGYTFLDGAEETEFRSGTGTLADGIAALIDAVQQARG